MANTIVDTLSFDKKVHADLLEEAAREERNKSQMASILIREALKARRAKSRRAKSRRAKSNK